MSDQGDKIRVMGYDPIADVVDEAWDRIERVLSVHKSVDAGLYFPHQVCEECYDSSWPCETVRILNGE